MKILITGGAGFIGTNFTMMALRQGHQIVILDNFCKEGSARNASLLRKLANVEIIEADITHPLPKEIKADFIVHLAGNVDAHKALNDPKFDFMVNAAGTLNLLEQAKKWGNVPVLFASTCKVYTTEVNNLPLIEENQRYTYQTTKGIREDFGIDAQGRYGRAFYGCSKYVGDLYAQEYHTLHGLPVVINRMSTIYGPYQCGTQGYGWVYWFTKAVQQDLTLSIFGNGKQVRDILHVDDLCRLMLHQIENIREHQGQIYNVGGGSQSTLSILELLDLLAELKGESFKLPVRFEGWRPADFRVYISDITKVSTKANWFPTIPVREGIQRLWKEVEEEAALFL